MSAKYPVLDQLEVPERVLANWQITADLLAQIVGIPAALIMREGDTIARLGGDEFVAVLSDIRDIPNCIPLLNRLLQAAARPVPIGDRLHEVSASPGVTFVSSTDPVVKETAAPSAVPPVHGRR